MSHDHLSGNAKLPAPCIVDTGIVINKQDITRLLTDLSRVRYCYSQQDDLLVEDEGYVMEVFSDPQRSTLVANHSLYINVHSFDYLELKKLSEQPCFDLIQDNRQLRLIPLSNPLQEQNNRQLINAADLEAVVAEVLSASWDMQLDDEENFLS